MRKKRTSTLAPQPLTAYYITYNAVTRKYLTNKFTILLDESGQYYNIISADGTKLAFACFTKDLNFIRQHDNLSFHLWSSAPLDKSAEAFRYAVTKRLLKEVIEFNHILDASDVPPVSLTDTISALPYANDKYNAVFTTNPTPALPL